VRRVAPFVLLALVLAGCGARSSTPYTAEATVPCLKDEDFTGVTTNPAKIGFIAALAPLGGLKATSPLGNTVTIAFAEDADSVEATERAFTARAPKSLRPRMRDIMFADRNAVIVWTTAPKGDDTDAVAGCLAS
jgi:hypothetical protein